MASEFEIVVGTYEQFMLGYKVERTIDAKYAIKQTFATRSHTESIRSVAACDRYLASAGSDDRVFVYDMNTRKEIQMLIHHKGNVNTVAFTPKASHIITGSSDGSISMVRTGNWQLEKLWGSAHKQASVNNIAVHPSGKMALSVGGDYVLRTWNLVKGRHAYATNLASRAVHGRFADTIQWSPSGILFTLTGSKIFEIWSISNAEVIDSIEFEAKVVSAAWISDTKVVCGLEDGNMSIYETVSKENKVIKAHNNRVKCIAATKGYIVTCDSSGNIKLWSNYDDEDVTEISSINVSCRITCITLVDNNCLKKETDEEKVIADVQERNKNSDSEDEHVTNEDIPVVKPRREVIIMEEEINEIKIPLGNKKINKQQMDNVDRKQKNVDGSFFKLNQNVSKKIKGKNKPEEKITSESIDDSRKKNKLKRKLKNDNASVEEDLHEEINEASESKKIKKKSNKSKSNLNILEVVEHIAVEEQVEKVTESKKSKKNKNASNNLELEKKSAREGVVERKNSKKEKPKNLNIDSNNLDVLENTTMEVEENVIEYKKSKKDKSKKNKNNLGPAENTIVEVEEKVKKR